MGEARNDAGARDVADGIASAVSRLRRCKDTHTYVCIYLSVYPSMGLCVRGVMLMLDALRHDLARASRVFCAVSSPLCDTLEVLKEADSPVHTHTPERCKAQGDWQISQQSRRQRDASFISCAARYFCREIR